MRGCRVSGRRGVIGRRSFSSSSSSFSCSFPSFAAAAAVLALATLAACGSDSASGVRLTIAPPSAQTKPQGEPITFTASLSGSADTVARTLSGPGSLDTMVGPTTRYVPPICLEEDLTATLTATAGEASSSAIIQIVGERCTTVAGRLVDGYGAPVANAPVLLLSHPLATTDANGRFLVHDVQRPYDVAYAGARGEGRLAVVIRGLAKMDPVLHLEPTPITVEPAHGTIKGKISGGAPLPLTDTDGLMMLFDSNEGGGVLANLNNATRAYEVSADWLGPETTGTLYALEWRFDAMTTLPVSYHGFASLSGVRLQAGETLEGQDLSLAPIETGRFSGAVKVPAGYEMLERTSSLQVGSGSAIDLVMEYPMNGPLPSGFNYLLPKIPGATATVHAQSQSLTSRGVSFARLRGLPVDAHEVVLDLKAAAEGREPQGGEVVDALRTNFRWDGGTGVAELVLVPEETSGLTVYVVLLGQSTVVGDLESIGVTAPSKAKYAWLVRNRPTMPTVDEFVGEINPFDVIETASVAAFRRFSTP